MSYYSGRDGSLFLEGKKLAKVANWSLTGNVDALETTGLGDDERTYTPGLKSATGSASLFYYDDAPKPFLARVFNKGVFTDNSIVTLSLRWGTKNIDVDALITSAQLSSQVGAVMQANVSFTVTGNYLDVDL